MAEIVVQVTRQLSLDDALLLTGTHVGTPLEPTIPSPRPGSHVRIMEGTETIGLVTHLPTHLRQPMRRLVTVRHYGEDVARHKKAGVKVMSLKGSVFGYSPPQPLIRQEGCRVSRLGRDEPELEQVLEDTADHLTGVFATLMPAQAAHDREAVTSTVLADWRMGDSLWTSGVINQANTLPYHRDGNNLDTWSAMPTLRMGMDGGRLHLPEYGIVFPCGDGDVTWFYGRGLVHGVTPMRRARPDGYRYSLVFYALKGLKNCATYAEETAAVAGRRTERERRLAAEIRAAAGVAPE